MYAFLLIVHLLVCILLVAVVLVQSGKGGGLAGGAFGGSAQTVFGGRGATDFITRATMVLGGAFFATSLVLSLMSSGVGQAPRSLIQEEARQAPATVPPAAPGQTPAPGQAPATTPPASTPPATSPPPAPGSGGP
jgi:preprotein translocase subunit SecG